MGIPGPGPTGRGLPWRGGPGLSCSMGARGWSPDVLVNSGWPICSGRSHSQGVILQSWLVVDTLVRKCRAAVCKEGRQKQSWGPTWCPVGKSGTGSQQGSVAVCVHHGAAG